VGVRMSDYHKTVMFLLATLFLFSFGGERVSAEVFQLKSGESVEDEVTFESETYVRIVTDAGDQQVVFKKKIASRTGKETNEERNKFEAKWRKWKNEWDQMDDPLARFDSIKAREHEMDKFISELIASKEYKISEDITKQILQYNEEAFGVSDDHLVNPLYNLAGAYIYGQKYKEAESVLKRSLSIMNETGRRKGTRVMYDPKFKNTVRLLMTVYMRQNNKRDALELLTVYPYKKGELYS